MTKAHTDHNGNSGIQNHSCGEFYPVVVSCVGGYPGPENDAYYKLIHPCGLTAITDRAEMIPDWVDYLKATEHAGRVLYRLISEDGGGSVRHDTKGTVGYNPRTGFMASYADSERVIDSDKLTQWDCIKFVADNPTLSDYWGGWVNDGKVYLDVSAKFDSRVECIVFAAENNQLAYYDCAAGEAINV